MFISYLNFLLTSTNQHGVHSPFIYNYVTKCLYSKHKYSKSKSKNVLFKSISHFDAKSIWLPSNSTLLRNQIGVEHPSIDMNSKPNDIIFIDASDLEAHFSMLFERIHNDSMLLVDSIYKDQANTKVWEEIKRHKKVRVSVDMFHCGAIFFRKEQATEHFKIRI